MKLPYAIPGDPPKKKKRFLELTKENLKPYDDEYKKLRKTTQ
jgi:hypothetical protein